MSGLVIALGYGAVAIRSSLLAEARFHPVANEFLKN